MACGEITGDVPPDDLALLGLVHGRGRGRADNHEGQDSPPHHGIPPFGIDAGDCGEAGQASEALAAMVGETASDISAMPGLSEPTHDSLQA